MPNRSRPNHPLPTRRVAILAFPGVHLLDVAGPLEVFAAASLYAARADRRAPPSYGVSVLSAGGGPVRCSSGLEVGSDPLAKIRPGEFDTVLAAGGPEAEGASRDGHLLAWLREAAALGGARRIGSVCTGAFLLAAAGLLDGRRATTHWAYAARLAAAHPAVRVEADPIFVRDSGVWTSAGVTTGMDLALAMVEEDHGRALALDVARGLVMFLKRAGGQAQFSAPLAAQETQATAAARFSREFAASDINKDGVLTKDEVEAIRRRSNAANTGPWVSDWGEMSKKTVLRSVS